MSDDEMRVCIELAGIIEEKKFTEFAEFFDFVRDSMPSGSMKAVITHAPFFDALVNAEWEREVGIRF